MSSTVESNQRWFSEVVQPKLLQLREWAGSTQALVSLELTQYFKDLLIDLEVLSLDNFTVEIYMEDILDGARTLERKEISAQKKDQLKQIAMMALLQNTFDRALFKEYWTVYRPLMKRSPDLKDQSLINAFKLHTNLKKLADYIELNVLNPVAPDTN